MLDLDKVLAALGLDPATGLEVLPVGLVERRPPAGDLPAVIMGLERPEDLERVRSALRERCPAGHPLTVVGADGTCRTVTQAEVSTAALPAALYLPPWDAPAPRRHPLDPLVEVMARLRGPGGCPWDREQTHASLRPYMLEEAYEAVEAITAGDPERLREELGDVLLQVVFHAQIARERGVFTVDDVVRTLTEKLIRRHPHVFGDVEVRGAADVVRNWEAIKAAEKGEPAAKPLLSGVGKGLPALARAYEVQKQAARVGFDWPDITGAMAKVEEEWAELRAAADPRRQEEEVGDLLFAVVNVARFLGVHPEVALTTTVAKFMQRFARIEAEARRQGKDLREMTLAEMDAIWEAAKNTRNP